MPTPDGPARDVLDVDDLSAAELTAVLDEAAAIADGTDPAPALAGANVAMLFEQPSTRTRVSFEVGVSNLGGDTVFLGPGDTQLARGEPVADTARSLSGYVDAIVARVERHGTLEALAAHADVPVVNALSDRAHPCQTLADLLTLREVAGSLPEASVAWVGDGNNVAASFALGCAMTGVDLTVATPPGYGLPAAVVERAADLGTAPTVVDDPETAVEGVDAVYTDVWASMSDGEKDLDAFEPYQVNEALLSGTEAAFMHCLPANRGQEVTDAVVEGERSVVFRQAEHRLHGQEALLSALLSGDVWVADRYAASGDLPASND